MSSNAEMQALWNGEATEAWRTHPDRYDTMLAPFSDRVLYAAALQPGERVLDVGCGSGALSRAAAAAVGPDGAVTGLDIARPLLELAREKTADAAVANLEFVEADAQTDRIESGPFDAIVSRFGVMFFADPVAAFTNLRSAASSGGRLACVAWQPLADNEWAMVPVMAVIPHVGMPDVPPPDAPGPFAFGDPDRVRGILADAGWTDIAVEPMTTDVLVGGRSSLDGAVAFYQQDAFGKNLLGGADAAQQEAAAGALHDALSGHAAEDGVRLGAAVWIVTASA